MSSPFARTLAAVAVLAGIEVPLAARAQGQCGCARMRAEQASAEERLPPFAPSSLCALCHSNAPAAGAMRDARAREISPHLLWSGTAMASAFRDPIWRAAVAAELAAAPSHAREIVAACLRCHAPMGARTLPEQEVSPALLEAGGGGALTEDGVSCTVCHRIAAEGLGEPATFGGAFRLIEDGRIAGPHEDPFTMPMLHHTGFEPVHGAQLLHAGLCGSCHTVLTTPVDAPSAGASFLEQGPYLEWRNSAFGRDASARGAPCQACHAPVLGVGGEVLETRIARAPMGRDFPPLDPRRPYGRHVFVGGNTLLPRLLAGAAAGGDEAPPPYEAVATLAAEQLARRTAQLELEQPRVAGGKLSFVARVRNLTGHKFPTGHPIRRAWLRVRVLDGAGRVVFASGEHDAAGRLLGATGRPLPSELPGGPAVPHRAVVRAQGEVQVYEQVMEDAGGAVTETLLQAVRAHKDDRLLPAGWAPEHPDAARTRPVGTDGDADFEAGADGVTYEVPLPPRVKRPLRVEATLLYQPLGARHAAQLTGGTSEAARTLAAALQRHGNAPATVAAAQRSVK